jgi:hypothetical protein
MRYKALIKRGDQLVIEREEVRDGEVVGHAIMMPLDVVAIRAGEYGLDPVDDVEAVWDILLHEGEATDGEEIPLIVTAATLEEARDGHIARCRAVRDAHHRSAGRRQTTPDQDLDHVEVLNALATAGNQDRQLASLAREEMKRAVMAERARRAPTLSRKAQMIDRIRDREGV